ncbi:MAG: GtrA family protein [Bacteroidales bacterium]
MIVQFIKFAFVGASGTVVDFGMTWLMKEKMRLNKYLANSIGFLIAATSNFIINRYWTFHSENPDISGEYFRFMLISLIGLSINNAVIYSFSQQWADRYFTRFTSLRFYISKIIATGIVVLWNFFMNYFFTFVS